MWRMIAIGTAITAVLAGCEDETPAPTQQQAEGTAETEERATGEQPTVEAPQQEAAIGVRSEEPYGDYLVSADGRTLYMFTADAKGESSSCEDECAQNWPPLLTGGELRAEGDAKAEMLGTISRPDGTSQVTYNGWPLYHFAQDRAAGQFHGQGAEGFGGEWYMLDPQGEKIEVEGEERAGR